MALSTISVHISGHLKNYIGEKKEVRVSGAGDIVQLVYRLNEMFPGIRDRILDDQDKPREYVNIFVNGENVKDGAGEKTILNDGDKVHLLPSIAGGQR
jgi:molybdopterin synthase sulfur carrier subunit